MVYKKSDKLITGFVAEDRTYFVSDTIQVASEEDDTIFIKTDTHSITTNKLDWTDTITVNSEEMLKTFEDVSTTINNVYKINADGTCALK